MSDDDAKDEGISRISKAIEEKLSPRTEYATVGDISAVLQSLLSLAAATDRLTITFRRYIATGGHTRDHDIRAIDDIMADINNAQNQSYRALEGILSRYLRQADDQAG